MRKPAPSRHVSASLLTLGVRCQRKLFALLGLVSLTGTITISLTLLALPTLARAQAILSASPDITIDLGSGVVATDEDVAVDNQLGIVLLENLGALPEASDVIALGLDVNGDRLIAFETTTLPPGGVIARKGDVIRYDGVSYSIEFDASVAGGLTTTATDAVSLSANGLLLSFDTTVSLPGGVVVADEDLVEWDGASFSIVFDGSAEGIDSSLDIDAAQDIGPSGWMISFDTTGSIGGIVFADEDVLRFDGTNWSLEVDSSTLSSTWAAADLDAIMLPEPGLGLGLMIGVGGIRVVGLRRRRRHFGVWSSHSLVRPAMFLIRERVLILDKRVRKLHSDFLLGSYENASRQ